MVTIEEKIRYIRQATSLSYLAAKKWVEDHPEKTVEEIVKLIPKQARILRYIKSCPSAYDGGIINYTDLDETNFLK